MIISRNGTTGILFFWILTTSWRDNMLLDLSVPTLADKTDKQRPSLPGSRSLDDLGPILFAHATQASPMLLWVMMTTLAQALTACVNNIGTRSVLPGTAQETWKLTRWGGKSGGSFTTNVYYDGNQITCTRGYRCDWAPVYSCNK